MLTNEYLARRSREAHVADLEDFILSCGDDQSAIVNKAGSLGFIKFDLKSIKLGKVAVAVPRGKAPTSEDPEMANRVRLAEQKMREAMRQKAAAKLEYETAELQRKKAEEDVRREAAFAKIAASKNTQSTVLGEEATASHSQKRLLGDADEPKPKHPRTSGSKSGNVGTVDTTTTNNAGEAEKPDGEAREKPDGEAGEKRDDEAVGKHGDEAGEKRDDDEPNHEEAHPEEHVEEDVDDEAEATDVAEDQE